MILKTNTATAVDKAIQAVTRHDVFCDEVMRDFRQITPEVGSLMAEMIHRGIDNLERVPPGARRVPAMMALGLAAIASEIAMILDEVGDIGGARQKAAVMAFEALLKEAVENGRKEKLRKFVEGHA